MKFSANFYGAIIASAAIIFLVACGAEPVGTPVPIPELTPTLATTAGGGCVANTPQRISPSALIKKVTMAEGVKGDQVEAQNPTGIFNSTATFYAVLAIENAPAKTKFKAAWYATDTKGVAPCNAKIGEYELETDGTRNINFNATPDNRWALGSYRVELFVNGIFSHVVNFVVR
ncbi:MAG: hypothetical protein HY070_01055 [Chloroflexi bacterium]|nr:hypothetical protein [Chloroflexota bacterium]